LSILWGKEENDKGNKLTGKRFLLKTTIIYGGVKLKHKFGVYF
jgi:hypothetical protein